MVGLGPDWAQDPISEPGPKEVNSPYTFQRVFASIPFEQPLFITYAPGYSNQIFVVEKTGRIKKLDLSGGFPVASVYLDLSGKITTSGEQGLLGLAFPPDFKNRKRLFVYYSTSSPARSVIASYEISDDSGRAVPNSEQSILEWNQPYSNHNGGMIAFGPDGYLYIGSGDGGSGGDPHKNGQNRSTLLGKILRLDVNGKKSYVIPEGNPFRESGPAIRKEIYALGLRNPWRFSFDRKTGYLWVGDVGQNKIEEIDMVVSGGNYGWRYREGSALFKPEPMMGNVELVDPVYEYKRDMGASVTGGIVYRGNEVSGAFGRYFFADYVKGAIYSFPVDGISPGEKFKGVVETVNSIPAPVSFGEDEYHELYLVSIYGYIYKLFGKGK